MKFDGVILKKICPNLDLGRAVVMAEYMKDILPFYGIYNKEVLPDFIAQCAHESGNFRIRSENMAYNAKRLMKVWPSRFKTLASTVGFVMNPVALAKKVYNGRMGNKIGSNDGYDNRGAGFIMITGLDIAKQYGKHVGNSDTKDLMERIRSEDYWALDSAAWVFAVEKKLIPLAKKDDVVGQRKSINGGLIGLEEVEVIFDRANKYIK